MNWAICTLTSTGKSRAVNVDLVAYADSRGQATLLTLVTGESFAVTGTLDEWVTGLKSLT